ncbi:unnamed protein product [Dibothriocephalus latus]|uniref:Uncharacterized protein n=1 Tax=Dibothriocephalus latus TaxID=60516 RepID=A0A3P7NF60_DIBLA|nr:unnamed protein product [Dibothriocephalus latus]
MPRYSRFSTSCQRRHSKYRHHNLLRRFPW